MTKLIVVLVMAFCNAGGGYRCEYKITPVETWDQCIQASQNARITFGAKDASMAIYCSYMNPNDL
jgi:hypothetical protein